MATTFDGARAGSGWGWLLAYGILSVILGLCAFAWPFSATYAATVVVGCFLMAAGIVSIISGVTGATHEGRTYQIVFGIISLIVGLIMAFEPATGALSLTLLVAIWLGLRGVMEIVLGSRFRQGRGLMIVLGIVNILLALYVLATLGWSAAVLPGFILGISFLFGGITAIMAAANHRKGASAFAV